MLLAGTIGVSVLAIQRFEREYPLSEGKPDVEKQKPAKKHPSANLDRLMSIVYPGSLGLDEGIAHLSMKVHVSRPQKSRCFACDISFCLSGVFVSISPSHALRLN